MEQLALHYLTKAGTRQDKKVKKGTTRRALVPALAHKKAAPKGGYLFTICSAYFSRTYRLVSALSQFSLKLILCIDNTLSFIEALTV